MTSVSPAPSLPIRARVGTTMLFFANGFGIGAWAAGIPRLKSMLALSDAQLSLALLAMAAGAILAMPFAGRVASLVGGAGGALRGASIGFGLVLCLPGLSANLSMLVAMTFLLGAVNGLMDVHMNAHATVVERGWGAAIMSSFHAAWSCGGLAGASVAGLVIAGGVSTPWLFGLLGAIVLAVVLAAGAQAGGSEGAAPRRSGFAWPDRRLLSLYCIALLGMLMEGAMTDWSAVYLTSVIDLAPSLAAGGYAAFAGAMLAGRFVGDHAVRKLGRTRIIMVGAALAALGMLLAAAFASPVTAILGFFLVGLGMSNMIPAVFSASAAASSSAAAGISMAATVGYAGFLLGPPFIGAIASIAGLRVSFSLLALVLLALVPLAAAARTSGEAAN